MEAPTLLDLYRSDLRGVLQGLLALCVILALAYGGAAARSAVRGRALKRAFRIIRKSRRQTWRARRERREAVGTMRDLAAQLVDARRESHEKLIENRRLEGIRSKLDRACKTKHAELEHAQNELRRAKLMIPPATASPPTLTEPVGLHGPLDLDLDVEA